MVDEGEETSPQVVTLCQAGSSPVVHPQSIDREPDEWSSTGPENRGGGDEPQRFDSSALVLIDRRRCPLTAGDLALNQETAGSTPPSVTHDRFGYTARLPDFQSGDAGSNPAAVATPTATGSRPALRTQALEVRVLSWVPVTRHWRRAGVVTGRFAKPWPTTVARVRFAPSPPLVRFVRSAGPK